MAYSHVAHDCQLADGVIMANCASLAGHIHVEEGAILGGLMAVHQFVAIGKYCMVGGMTRVTQDIIPFTMAAGNPCSLHGLNTVGLKRRGFSPERIHQLHSAYRIIFKKGLALDNAIKALQDEMPDNEDVRHVLRFIEKTKRGIAR